MVRSFRRVLRACAAAALLCVAAPLAATAASPPAAASPVAVEQIGGDLEDGTRWIAQKPANWNGTLLLDLDAAGTNATPPPAPRPNPFNDWLFAQGYAIGGVTREPVGYDFPRAVDYLLDVRRAFAARWRAPRRTLAVGNSRGAFVLRKALELHPEVFDGGLMSSGGGAGEIAVLRNKLNTLFVLKTLVDPTSPLKLVNIETAPENAALIALTAKARATPQGRARMALATGIAQFAPWTSRGTPKPAPNDYDGQLDQIFDNFVFATAVPVRTGVEIIAGGNVSWNTGVDYAALLRRSGRLAMVEALYAKAGLKLADDLSALARAPRIKADRAAVRRAEPLMTYTGKIRAPLVNVDNDDPVDPASDKIAYRRTLEKAGTAGLFRLIWADGPGHGGQSNLDRAVGFQLLIERLETGRWSDTTLPALKRRAAEISRATPVDLGASTLFDPGPLPAPATTWDVVDWGRYRGR